MADGFGNSFQRTTICILERVFLQSDLSTLDQTSPPSMRVFQGMEVAFGTGVTSLATLCGALSTACGHLQEEGVPRTAVLNGFRAAENVCEDVLRGMSVRTTHVGQECHGTTHIGQEGRGSTTIGEEGSTHIGQEDRGTTHIGQKGRAKTHIGQEDRGTTQIGQEDRGTTQIGQEGRGTTTIGREGHGAMHIGQEGHSTTHIGEARPRHRGHAARASVEKPNKIGEACQQKARDYARRPWPHTSRDDTRNPCRYKREDDARSRPVSVPMLANLAAGFQRSAGLEHSAVTDQEMVSKPAMLPPCGGV